MTYHYPSTPAERAAAALLRRKGWTVGEPQCPDCRGFGIIGRIDDWGSGKTTTYASIKCPRGCPAPTMFL